MYGSVMVCTFNGDRGAVVRALEDWRKERSGQVKGFVDFGVMFADDGKTLMNYAMFVSKRDYVSLADDPQQDAWFRARMQPLLTGEPEWTDGEWAEFID